MGGPVHPARSLGLLLAAIVLLVSHGVPVVAEESDLPRLVVEAPERYTAVAERLERLPRERFRPAMRMIGLDAAGEPIQVELATESSPEARAAPLWVAGYAYGALARIVLFVERTPSYPDGSLEALLDHEVAHVLIARAAAHRPVPRWFNEGVSMVAGHAWGLADTSRLTLAAITRSGLTRTELDDMFTGHSGEVSKAYAVSGAMVRDMLRRYDRGVVARILADLRFGLAFEEAFHRSTGVTVDGFEASFWRRHSFWYRWVPLLGSSVTLWFGITLLALYAFRRRRQRDADIRARWEIEEELERLKNEPGEQIM